MQDQEDDDEPSLIDESPVEAVEPNVMCSLFVLLCGPVFDALCALPGVVRDDLPASLRATCLVLVILLGTPPIRHDRSGVLEQRAVVGVLLAVCSLAGLNEAESGARNADAVFAFVGTTAAVVAVVTNGAAVQDSSIARKRETREHVSALAASLFFYGGMRTIRHALAMPSEVSNFKVDYSDVTSPGYAIATELVVAGNAFSGAVAVSFGCILLMNHDLVLHLGSDALSTVAGVLASFAVLGALVAQLGAYGSIEQLPALFSESGCNGSYDECSAAYRARRFFFASNSTSVAWTTAIAMATFAFSAQKEFETRRQHFEHRAVLSVGNASVLLAALLACGAVFLLAEGATQMATVEIELVLLILAVPLALLHWPATACAAHASGQVLYVFGRIQSPVGFSWLFFTHFSLVATLVLTILVALCSLASYALYSCGRLYSDPVELVCAVATTSLVSVQLFLTLGTLGMAAGYTGCGYSMGSGGWRSTGYSFTVQHCVSFFFAAAIFATRYECRLLLTRAWARRLAWAVAPVSLACVWASIVLAHSTKRASGDPYTQFVDVGSFVIGVSTAAVAWAGVGWSFARVGK